MESSQVKNILSKYLTVEKNVDIFSKHIARVDDEDLLDQILFELCVDLNAKKSIKECYKKFRVFKSVCKIKETTNNNCR